MKRDKKFIDDDNLDKIFRLSEEHNNVVHKLIQDLESLKKCRKALNKEYDIWTKKSKNGGGE